MRIMQIIDTLNPGGAERMAVNLANAFDSLPIDHKLVVSRLDGGLSKQVNSPQHLTFLGKKNTFDFYAFKKLRKEVKDFQPDVLHAHGTSIYWAVALKYLSSGFKLIWHDHLGISDDVLKNNPRKELSIMSGQIDYIITADEKTKDHWINKNLKDRGLIRYLRNFPHLVSQKKTSNELFTFIHLANYRSEKGHMMLIEAVKRLKDNSKGFQVIMAGAAIDKSWKDSVVQKVKEEGLEDLIQVEGAKEDVGILLAQVDAGLVVSDREGLPVALLEYGLAGLPVISTDVGQCGAVLMGGKLGHLIAPGDSKALADKMESMIKSPVESIEMGDGFKVHVERNYGFEHFYKEYQEILDQLEVPRKEVLKDD